jgi:hypothetical protein
MIDIDSATSVANSFKKKENLDKKYFVGDDDLLYENQINEDDLSLNQKSNIFHQTIIE